MNSEKKNTYSASIQVEGEQKLIAITKAFCIGYTGRNKEKTLEHIKELAEIGVPEPSEIPSLYPVSVSTLNQGGAIEVIGELTSGEAEIVLLFGDSPEEIYLSVGSDHTDRGLETVDINKSKQVCDKPFAEDAWKIEDVMPHWDKLELSSEVFLTDSWEPYQQNPISAIISLGEIKSYLAKKEVPLTNSIVFSGTVPLLDGFKYGTKFKLSITDPVRGKVISTEYMITNIAH